MRGKPATSLAAALVQRNIPAYAGKTGAASGGGGGAAEHPRVCGENTILYHVGGLALGTSPRMRGKPSSTSAIVSSIAEHPRVCGENELRAVGEKGRLGTSPRMRGKPGEPRKSHDFLRNIPAYAGKTAAMHFAFDQQTEHPRVCGENAVAPLVGEISSGTSPRMRGKRHGSETTWSDRRNIPAYAGKTCVAAQSHQPGAEHPRVCGENHPV